MVCFHNPNEENCAFSNWYLSDFTDGGVCYSSMEQFMMHRKALLFEDNDIAAKILATDDTSAIKAYGRAVQNYNDVIWSGMRQVIVFEGLWQKYRQNSVLKDLLLLTGDEVMAECAVKDSIWGIGLSMEDAGRFEMSQWHGQNLLGFAHMEVRYRLRMASSESHG